MDLRAPKWTEQWALAVFGLPLMRGNRDLRWDELQNQGP